MRFRNAWTSQAVNAKTDGPDIKKMARICDNPSVHSHEKLGAQKKDQHCAKYYLPHKCYLKSLLIDLRMTDWRHEASSSLLLLLTRISNVGTRVCITVVQNGSDHVQLFLIDFELPMSKRLAFKE